MSRFDSDLDHAAWLACEDLRPRFNDVIRTQVCHVCGAEAAWRESGGWVCRTHRTPLRIDVPIRQRDPGDECTCSEAADSGGVDYRQRVIDERWGVR